MQNNDIEQSLFVVNVLDKFSYDDCHIKGSIQIPFDQVEHFLSDKSKDVDIVLYCSNYTCGTSEYVARRVQELGFTNVQVYEGGTAEWFQSGLPTVGPAKNAYLSHKIKKPVRSIQQSISVISMVELAQKLGVDRIHLGKNLAA